MSTPQPVYQPANPASPVTTPQFDAPFRLDANGLVATVEQNSAADVAACAYNIAVCPAGFKLGDSTFGVPSMLFGRTPINATAVINAIRRLEPRASVAISVTADATGAGTQDVTINITPVAGSPNG